MQTVALPRKEAAVFRPFRRASFAAGTPARPFGTTGCVEGGHIGQMLDLERLSAAGAPWNTQATCSNCNATIGRDEFVTGVAMDDILRGMESE